MRRWLKVSVAGCLLLGNVGCHGRLFRRPCADDCPTSPPGGGRSGGGRLELGDPVPGSGNRLPPADVPTGDFPAPRTPETRNALDPFGPDGRRYQPATPRRVPPADIPLPPADAGELPPRG